MGLQACTSRGGELAPDCLFRWWEYGRFLYCFLLYVSLVAKSCLTLLRPHRLQPTRLLCPSVFPGKNTGVDCHPLLQGNLLNPGIEPASPALQVDSLLLSHQGSPIGCRGGQSICLTYVRIDLKRHPGVRAALVNSGEESGI